MVSIRAQSAAAASRQNSPHEGENLNSLSASENSNPTPEGDQISPQGLLPQNFPSTPSTIRQPTRSVFEDIEEMSITSVLIKASEISLLNESSD